ncbi:hypothetical protein DFH06DRAFT_1125391 [Mycena polygramma]|nr:hypothetical protein DFH06DRAFT_1125391 [Mycena polygramma]
MAPTIFPVRNGTHQEWKARHPTTGSNREPSEVGLNQALRVRCAGRKWAVCYKTRGNGYKLKSNERDVDVEHGNIDAKCCIDGGETIDVDIELARVQSTFDSAGLTLTGVALTFKVATPPKVPVKYRSSTRADKCDVKISLPPMEGIEPPSSHSCPVVNMHNEFKRREHRPNTTDRKRRRILAHALGGSRTHPNYCKKCTLRGNDMEVIATINEGLLPVPGNGSQAGTLIHSFEVHFFPNAQPVQPVGTSQNGLFQSTTEKKKSQMDASVGVEPTLTNRFQSGEIQQRYWSDPRPYYLSLETEALGGNRTRAILLTNCLVVNEVLKVDDRRDPRELGHRCSEIDSAIFFFKVSTTRPNASPVESNFTEEMRHTGMGCPMLLLESPKEGAKTAVQTSLSSRWESNPHGRCFEPNKSKGVITAINEGAVIETQLQPKSGYAVWKGTHSQISPSYSRTTTYRATSDLSTPTGFLRLSLVSHAYTPLSHFHALFLFLAYTTFWDLYHHLLLHAYTPFPDDRPNISVHKRTGLFFDSGWTDGSVESQEKDSGLQFRAVPSVGVKPTAPACMLATARATNCEG